MLTIRSPDDVDIAVERAGDGDPLVLVHGVLSDHTNWNSVCADLQRQFTVYAMDRRGRGESGDSATYRLEREIDDLIAVVESIDGPANLVAHSFGAVCALEAARSLDELSSLVLYEPPIVPSSSAGHPYPPDAVAAMRTSLERRDPERVVETFRREVSGYSEDDLEEAKRRQNWTDQVAAAETLVREIDALEHFSFDPSVYRSISTPTTLLAGSETPGERLEVLDQLEEVLPRCQRRELSGQGHVAMVTGPKFLAEAIVESDRVDGA